MKQKIFILLFSILLFFSCNESYEIQKLELHGLFSNHMVIQRDTSLLVKGWLTAKQELEIEASWGEKVQTKSRKDGTWEISIPTPPAGGPFELKITSEDTSILITDILSGEVWVASGQSNMKMPLKGWKDTITNADEEIVNANIPNIRFLTIAEELSFSEEKNISASWIPASSDTASHFSAAAWFFAKKLQAELNVPIGIIVSAWGGTPGESWMPVQNLKKIEAFKKDAENLISAREQYPKFQEWTKTAEYIDMNELKKQGNQFALIEMKHIEYSTKEYADSSWKEIKVTKYWEEQELGNFDGIVWYRKEFHLANFDSLKSAKIYLGAIDDIDITYVNGVEIGSHLTMGHYNTVREYEIPKGILKEGKNVISLRVIDFAGKGGLFGSKDLTISQSDTEIANISEHWKHKAVATILSSSNLYWITDENPMPALDMTYGPHTPSALFNAMISPLRDYAIKGVIWYQGESNVGRAKIYTQLFPLLIEGWRSVWNQGDFPFYFVQIAPYDYKSGLATSELREAQRSTLSLKNTGMVVTMDLADLTTLHPANKQDVGKRLAYRALKQAYQTDIAECSGPVVKQIIKSENKIIIEFTHSTEGLVLKNENTKSFEIAGADSVFYSAKAKIINESIAVWSDKVKKPQAVRYLWSDFKTTDLYNGFGLPASPFVEYVP